MGTESRPKDDVPVSVMTMSTVRTHSYPLTIVLEPRSKTTPHPCVHDFLALHFVCKLLNPTFFHLLLKRVTDDWNLGLTGNPLECGDQLGKDVADISRRE